MPINIGQLRHRLELHSASSTDNDFGEPILTFASYTTVWGQVSPMKGEELFHAQQTIPTITHKVLIRYNSNVTAEHRVVFDSRTFEINAVLNPEERNEMLFLHCTEVK